MSRIILFYAIGITSDKKEELLIFWFIYGSSSANALSRFGEA